MDSVVRWPAGDRADLFREAASSRGIMPAVVEKDCRVCWLLGKLFADAHWRDKVLLKGGTSLSKAFGLDRALLRGHRSDPRLERSGRRGSVS